MFYTKDKMFCGGSFCFTENCEDQGYLYRTREDSITSQVMTAEHRKQNLLAQRERMEFFRKRRYWRAYLNLLIGYMLHVGWFGWERVKKRK